MKTLKHPLTKQIIAFGCVGIVATCTHYVSALVFVELVGGSLYLGNIVGYVLAVLISLYGHAMYTYKKTVDRLVAKRFFFVSISTLLATEGMVHIFESYIEISHRISMAIIVTVIPVFTFFLNKFWVYAHPKNV